MPPDDLPDDFPDDFPDDDVDPEKIVECAYWRCGELFEARTSNQLFCRKACRSRQRKWERAEQRRARRAGVTAAPAPGENEVD